MKTTRRIAVAFFAVYVALLGGLWSVMHWPETFGQVMKHVPDPAFIFIPFRQMWFSARSGSLKVGQPAPDFNLSSPDKKNLVKLSSLKGEKPVVLIFGSYT